MHGAEVIMEIYLTGEWRFVGGGLTPDTLTASITSRGTPREVYSFGWMAGQAGVWRSRGGFDIATPQLREVHALDGLELVGDLSAGPVELTLEGPVGPMRYRWRLR